MTTAWWGSLAKHPQMASSDGDATEAAAIQCAEEALLVLPVLPCHTRNEESCGKATGNKG